MLHSALIAVVLCCLRGRCSRWRRGREAASGSQPDRADRSARELHASSLMIDGHNDMPWEIRKQGSSSFDKLDISQPQPSCKPTSRGSAKAASARSSGRVWVPVETRLQGRGARHDARTNRARQADDRPLSGDV